ncbi:MAG: hypothetical protein IPK97_19995 [Ahniella sp.]|nr:hypothetical protein [Ahniella sp.]
MGSVWADPIHVLGVLHASWHHRENLVASMVHGQKAAEVDQIADAS